MDKWPYPTIDDMYKNRDLSWFETSEEVYYNQLECLPPAAMKFSVFAVGEPWTHNVNGYAIHSTFAQVNNRYFCRNTVLKDFDAGQYIKEIKDQFKLE